MLRVRVAQHGHAPRRKIGVVDRTLDVARRAGD
jgi:hypothetical protein